MEGKQTGNGTTTQARLVDKRKIERGGEKSRRGAGSAGEDCRMGTWNIRGLSGKEDELVQEFQRTKLDILGITETKKKGSGEMEMEGDHLLIYSGVDENDRARGGVGCIISSRYRKFVGDWSAIDERILKIEMKFGFNTTILVVYGPNEDGRVAEKDAFWERLNEIVEDVRGRLIVIGDINGRVGKKDEETGEVIGMHGEEERNNNGRRLINFCILNDMIVANTFFQHKEIHKYTREVKSRGEKSIIDYVLINRGNRKEVVDVRVRRGPEIYSDHYLLEAVMRMKVDEEEKDAKQGGPSKRRKQVVKNIRSYRLREPEIAERYKSRIEEEMEGLKVTSADMTVEDLWNTMKLKILNTASEICGITATGGGRKQTRWWNSDIQEQVKIKKRRWREYLQGRTNDAYEIYKRQRTAVKEMIASAKRRAWEEFGEKMERDSKGNQKLFFRVLKNLRRGKQGCMGRVRDRQGRIVNEEEEIMKRWREYFEELLNVEDDQQREDIQPEVYEAEVEEERHLQEEEEEEVQIEEVLVAVKMLKRGKAAGHDKITAEMIQNMGGKGYKLLTELYNKIWLGERIPEDWEIGIVVPLFKKGDSKDCNNYRGITLLSTMLKIYERILERRLRNILDSQLEESQSSFRRGRSSQDHVFTVRQLIEKRRLQGKNLYLAFVDIQKAFDSVPRKIIWQSLRERGIQERLSSNIRNIYRMTRSYVRKDNGQSEEFVTKDGLRQGGVLSPILFIMIMDDILKEVQTKVKRIHVGFRNMSPVCIAECVFADDLLLLAQNEEELQHSVQIWKEALAARNLKINMEKTKVMVVGEERICVGVEMDGTRLEQVSDFKYLGVHIQEDGRQVAELNDRISAAVKIYHALNRSLIGKREISRRTKLSVYKTIFCPILTYGCESWVLNNTMKSRLQAVEMKYLRRVKGITRRDRIRNEAVRNELKIEPILERVEKQQLSWFGHLVRMGQDRQVKKVWMARVIKKQGRGRPRKTWDNTVAELLLKRNLTWTEARAKARNKSEWARLVHK